VAVEVGGRQVLHRHAPLVDQVPLPLAGLRVHRAVDAHAAALARLVAQVVADADDQLVAAVAVEVGAPDGVAPAQALVQDVPVPGARRRPAFRRRVDDHLVAVPRLDRGDERGAVLELALLDLAGAPTAARVVLVAGPERRAGPLAAFSVQPA